MDDKHIQEIEVQEASAQNEYVKTWNEMVDEKKYIDDHEASTKYLRQTQMSFVTQRKSVKQEHYSRISRDSYLT